MFNFFRKKEKVLSSREQSCAAVRNATNSNLLKCLEPETDFVLKVWVMAEILRRMNEKERLL